MTKSAFGAVYSEIDGTPHPVVDTAGLCALRLWLSPLAIELEARPGRAADEGAGDVLISSSLASRREKIVVPPKGRTSQAT